MNTNTGGGESLNTLGDAAAAFDGLDDDALAFDPNEEEGGEDGQQPAAADPAPDDPPDADDVDPTVESDDDDAGADDDPGETGEDAPPFRTLDDVAKALGVENAAQLDDLEFTIPAAGENIVVTLSELKKGHQRDADYRKQTQELATTVRQNEQFFAQKQQQLDQQAMQVGGVLNVLKQNIVNAAQSPQMQALRTSNTAEWTAKNQEFQQQIAQIDQLYVGLANSFQQSQQQLAEQEQARSMQLRAQEGQKLRDAMPDFTAETDAQISNFLSSKFGFSAEEVRAVEDHRHVLIAHAAMKWFEHEAAAAKTKKQLRKVPKRPPPSKTQGSPQAKRKVGKVAKAKAHAKKTGKLRDAADAIGAIFDGNEDF